MPVQGTNRPSWRRLTRRCGPLFLDGASYRAKRLERVVELCVAVQRYVICALTSEDGRRLVPERVGQFIHRLPDVLGKCDEPIYDDPLAAEAYAFVHLVDRYRRFLDILEVLLRSGNLPVREVPLDTIDVGTGPAPALYAINDFYEELRGFAATWPDCSSLGTAPPTLQSIEKSREMVRLVHNLSEFTGRPGPFRAESDEFRGFNPQQERMGAREALIDELIYHWGYSEDEAYWQAQEEQARWQNIARYHIFVFSNFLTNLDQVQSLSTELIEVFRALKPRGIVIVVGGTGAHYPTVYAQIDSFAQLTRVLRIRSLPETIRCRYDDSEAQAIKGLYTSVFKTLRPTIDDSIFNGVLSKARDLWDPNEPLAGPRAFGIRIYRGPDMPPGSRFTNRRHRVP